MVSEGVMREILGISKNLSKRNGISEVTPANQTKERPVMNFSWGQTGTKIQCESRLFSQGKHQNSQKWAKFMNFSFFGPFFGLVCRGDS